jgi:choline-sulfatase
MTVKEYINSCGKTWKRVILDEYLFFSDMKDLYETIYYQNPDEVLIFSTPQVIYDNFLYRTIQQHKHKMSYFEWASRVPMIIWAPGKFSPRRVKQHVSLVDLLPTLMGIASEGKPVKYAIPIDGKSLVPLLKGRAEDENAVVYGEILCEGAISPVIMIRQGKYKYIYCDMDPEQLYDLENDPNETSNLAGQTEYEEVRKIFHDKIMEKWDTKVLREQVVASQHRRPVIDRSMRKGKFASWDFQPFEDASTKYMRNHLDLNVLERKARVPSSEIPEPDGRLGKRIEG